MRFKTIHSKYEFDPDNGRIRCIESTNPQHINFCHNTWYDVKLLSKIEKGRRLHVVWEPNDEQFCYMTTTVVVEIEE